MTTFTGKLLEYPFVSIDRFNDENLNSSVYFLSHCHKDHIEGLLDGKFIKRLQQQSTNGLRLYTSETTKNLMLCDKDMEDLANLVIGLPIHQPTHVNVTNEYSQDENIIVTLISAGHCVGSVMILFEGRRGNVLYTGDFRLGHNEIKKISISLTNLKSMYVDTTFLCPSITEFPTRENTKDCIISIVESWIRKGSNYMVHLKCKGRYGYEYIMKEVAKYFGIKLHVNQWRLRMSARLPNMLKHFTTTSTESQIHCCYFGRESFGSPSQLPCGLRHLNGKPIKLITIVPSSLYFMKKGSIPESGKAWFPQHRLWRVFHSMHASYKETREVVQHFKPDNIYPCVPPVDCQDIFVAYARLQDLMGKDNRSIDESQGSYELNEKINKTDTVRIDHSWKAEIQKDDVNQVEHFLASPDRTLQSPPPMRKRRHAGISIGTVGGIHVASKDTLCATPKKIVLQSMSADKNEQRRSIPKIESSHLNITFIEESTIERVSNDAIDGNHYGPSLDDGSREISCRDVKPNTVDCKVLHQSSLTVCLSEEKPCQDVTGVEDTNKTLLVPTCVSMNLHKKTKCHLPSTHSRAAMVRKTDHDKASVFTYSAPAISKHIGTDDELEDEEESRMEENIEVIDVSSGDEVDDGGDSDLTLSFSQEHSSDSSQTF